MSRAKTLVIGVTGPMTSGKAAIRYFLINRGFRSIRLTQPILDEGLKKKKDMTDRQNWIDILVEMRKKDGVQVLAEKADKTIDPNERYVICPIRHPDDINLLKDKYNALILYIDAPFETRYKRTFLKELGSKLTKKDFKRKDDTEMKPKGENKELLPNVLGCKKLADEVIVNDGTLNELNQKLETIMRKYNIAEKIDTGAYEGFEV